MPGLPQPLHLTSRCSISQSTCLSPVPPPHSLQPGQFVLYESASGYALFDIVEVEEIGALKPQVQASVTDLARFSKICKLKAFQVRC